MAQHDGVIADQTGLAFLADNNDALRALWTQHSGPTEPATTYAGMPWLDTSTTPPVLKQRNQANTDWATVSSLIDAEVMPSPTASGYVKRKSDNSGNETKTAQQVADDVGPLITPNYAPGHIYGLTLSNNTTDANNDIDIAAGSARDGADAVNLILASAITKQLDWPWSAGNGNGGRDAGSKAANTTYHVFLIRKDSDGTIDALFSTSATSPTMPGGYTAKRRIGSVRTDGSSNIVAFSQVGDQFLLSSPVVDVDVTNMGTSANLYALSVPSGVKVEALIGARFASSGTSALIITSPDQSDVAPTATGPLDAISSSYNASVQRTVRTDTSRQIRARASAVTANFVVTTHGWYDSRGRY